MGSPKVVKLSETLFFGGGQLVTLSTAVSKKGKGQTGRQHMSQMHGMEIQSVQMGEQGDLDQRAVKIENGVIQRKEKTWPPSDQLTRWVGFLSLQ